MKITRGDKKITTSCAGCYCHDMAMRFGDLIEGCCSECGCPKTKAAFDGRLADKEGAR